MKLRLHRLFHVFTLASIGLLAAVMTTAIPGAGAVALAQRDDTAAGATTVMPRYDDKGALMLPESYQRWVFAGSSLGLSYSAGQRGQEMFHHTLIEPSAYEYYVRTGGFREGTMLALLLHGTQSGVLPGRQGQFAGNLAGLEMAVKDKAHLAEGWAYYNFGSPGGMRQTAQAMPKDSCFGCHRDNAARDNVFLQFYSLLAVIHPLSPTELAHASTHSAELLARPQDTGSRQATPAPLALTGLDPVLLVDGREELGKPEIVAEHGGYRYQFVSEPDRARFAADPGRFAIQNKTCPIVAGAAIDPALFAVHEQRIYAFATSDCVAQFKGNPGAYVKKESR